MIITIGGKAGSGKTTIAKLLAKKLKLKHYSVGDLMRKMAKDKNIPLSELSSIAEKDNKIDAKLDGMQKELGKKKDNFVIDSRLSAFFIPNSIKLFLDADKNERAKRVLKDKREEEKGRDIKEMIHTLKKREKSEIKRYRKYYGFNCYKKSYYDFVIDTTNLNPKEVVAKIISLIKV